MSDAPTTLPAGVRLAHISDTHLGYEAYRAVAPSGENQRSADITRAFVTAGRDIATWDPPLVIHSGDVAERPHIPIRLMLGVRKWLADLAGLRADGSRRQVVVIAGNHDLPAHRREACFLQLFADVPGVHIVTDDASVITFDDAGEPGGAAAELASVRVTAVPHDTLKDLGRDDSFGAIAPLAGWLNVLVAHGVAGGSTLYRRVLGREYPIPTEVLGRGWDYVALGHWHRPGPVGAGATTTTGRVWYAGSTENMGFGDVLDNNASRGWNKVTLNPGELPTIERSDVPTRAMFRLPVVDGTGLDPGQVQAAIEQRLADATVANTLSGAVVGQVVRNVPRELWSLVDLTKARELAGAALHWEVVVEPVAASDDDSTPSTDATRIPGLVEIAAELRVVADETLGEHPAARRDAVVAKGTALLRSHLAAGDDDDDGDNNDGDNNDRSSSSDEHTDAAETRESPRTEVAT